MIEKNLRDIEQKIITACENSGRDPNDIKIVAVSKNHDPSAVIQVNNYGIVDFGENKAQELVLKHAECPQNVNWHFIGHLQRNKVKSIIPIVSLIHSVDSIKLAREINKRAQAINKIQNILLEINTSGEESKFGLRNIEDIYQIAEECQNLSNIQLHGLMTMAPYTDDEIIIRNSFRSLKNIFSNLNTKGFKLRDLSMGMTHDFEVAIEEGATIVRIGTAIFRGR
jgi:pyridoxal phosphate enzyme (YggS family)